MIRVCLVVLANVLVLPVCAQAGQQHWSLRPRSRPEVPRFTAPPHRAWVRNSVDAFILRRLLDEGLEPAREADRRTLVRRLSFDLTGLPPAPADVEAFVTDPAPNAYEKLVDRLLASPHYGEHWGRHWLDVVRYAETEGFEYDRYRPGAWRYRDYVIRAFQDDKPYDRFIAEQLAGDEGEAVGAELQIAAGFHRLGPVRRNAGNQKVAFSRNEVLTEMTDSIGAVFLGLTLGCARCHDHKFDAIAQVDYYRLQAFLAATHENDVVLAGTEAQADWKARTEEAGAEIKRLKGSLEKLKGEAKARTLEKLRAAESRLPPLLPTISSVRNKDGERTQIQVLKRGDPTHPGQLVGMRVLGALVPETSPELPITTPLPKTILAKWLTDADHPLTARVLVNRIWHYHFGRGIVETPNDFGANGGPPSHPELLDSLANEFVANGWRWRPIHRLILLSSTYRQAARGLDGRQNMAKDPENRLFWCFPRRRLSAEEVRDAMLAVSGTLNRKASGPSVVPSVDSDLVNLLYDPGQWTVTKEPEEHYRRSVYMIAKRNLRQPFLEVFDQPDLQTSCSRRESSTHALQALEMLNGKTSNGLAEMFARRLRREAGSDPARQVGMAFLLAVGRAPTTKERDLALRFLEEKPLQDLALVMFNLNAFFYVD